MWGCGYALLGGYLTGVGAWYGHAGGHAALPLILLPAFGLMFAATRRPGRAKNA